MRYGMMNVVFLTLFFTACQSESPTAPDDVLNETHESGIWVANTSPSAVSIIVNNGAACSLPENGGERDSPVSKAFSELSWGSMSGPNVLGPGNNYLTIASAGLDPTFLRLYLPNGSPRKVQIYLFQAPHPGGFRINVLFDGLLVATS